MQKKQDRDKVQEIDELVRGKYANFVLLSDSSLVVSPIMRCPGRIREHTAEELIQWLESKGAYKLDNGSYWREFADFAIHGEFVADETVTGQRSAEATTFKLTVSRHRPPSLLKLK